MPANAHMLKIELTVMCKREVHYSVIRMTPYLSELNKKIFKYTAGRLFKRYVWRQANERAKVRIPPKQPERKKRQKVAHLLRVGCGGRSVVSTVVS